LPRHPGRIGSAAGSVIYFKASYTPQLQRREYESDVWADPLTQWFEEWRPALYQALGLAQAMQSLLQARQAIKVASGQRIQRAGRAVRLFLLALQAP